MVGVPLNGRLVAIANEWDKAERNIKLAERIRGEVVQPSINELRYAGRRLVDAIREQSQETPDIAQFDASVTEALQFCYRAQHDAIDAAVLFIDTAMKEYEREFGLSLLIQYFPGVADLRARLGEADELIVASREDRLARHKEYERLATEQLPAILDEYKRIQSNKAVLTELANAALEREKTEAARVKAEQNRFQLNLWIGGAIAVASAFLGAVFAKLL